MWWNGDAKHKLINSLNSIKVLDWIVERPALEQRLVDVRLSSTEQDRVAIRTRASDRGRTQRRATATDVFDHHRPDKRFHFVRPWAANKVECAARRKRHNKTNGFGWVSLSPRDAGEDCRCGSARGEMQKLSAGKFHASPPAVDPIRTAAK